METVYLPNFLNDLPDIEIFRRLEVFTNLAVKFTSRLACGKDKSVKILKTLLEHPPLQGSTAMNNVLDLLKDVVLCYQAAKLTGNIPQPQGSNRSAAHKEKITKHKVFSKTTRRDVSKLLKAFSDTVTQHKTVMKKLRDAQLRYMIQHNCLSDLMRRYRETHDTPYMSPVSTLIKQASITHTTSSLDKLFFTIQSQATQGMNKGDQKLLKQMGKQHEEALKAYVGFKIYGDRERDMRKNKLYQMETIVRTLVEDRICGILSIGHDRLTQFAKEFSLPEEITDRLDQFDIHHVASQIFSQRSTRYIFPKMKDYTDITLISESRFESPNLQDAQDKHDILLGKSGSSMNLLEEEQNVEIKQEGMYVLAIEDSNQSKPAHILSFQTGQKLKQKFCSLDGTLAFGWKKWLPGCKTYGFYPTHSVCLVP